MVKQIYHECGVVLMNMNPQQRSKPKPKSQAQKRPLKGNDPVPRKRQKVSESSGDKDQAKNKGKAKAKGILASTWRWSPSRRTVAVNKANCVRLFDIGVESGKRDQKIVEITKEINTMTNIDVNFALMTAEHYKKEIYKIQRKVIKLGVGDEEAVLLLPKEEQELYKQLKDAGQVAEANKCTMSGNSSLV